MRTTTTLMLLALAGAVGAGACKSSKSSNPLSPSVAGPIPGVAITTPKLLQPTPGQSIEVGAQPLTLVFENASTTGQRPLSYVVEVAMDTDFTNKVLSRDSIAPGGNGQTSFKLPDPLAADRTYYWRAKAQDGANTGTFTAGASFSIYTPVVLQSPGLISPVGDTQVTARNPTLVVNNAARSGPVGAIVYEMQVSANDVFSQVVVSMEENEQAGNTKKTLAGLLDYDKRYYWRARAWEMTKNLAGPWSSVATFRTPAAPVVTPPPPPPPASGGRCPASGEALVNCVMAKYPSYLAAGVSSSQRRANMEFLRDRTIEEGLCAGAQLGWNLKRGGPELSVDYITYFTGGRWIGVDIARDYDNTSIQLQMTWFEAPDDPYATHADYTRSFSCK